MFKIKKLLTIASGVLSVNLLSINDSYTTELINNFQGHNNEGHGKIANLVKMTKDMAKDKGIDIGENKSVAPITLGRKYNEQKINAACEFVSGLYGVETLGKNKKEGTLSNHDLSVISILVDKISHGETVKFENAVNEVVYSVNRYAEPYRTKSSLDEDGKYIKGKEYLATAVLQEMLIKLARTGGAMLNKEDYDECCKIVCNYLHKQVELNVKKDGLEEIFPNKEYANWIEWGWKEYKQKDIDTIKEMVRESIVEVMSTFDSVSPYLLALENVSVLESFLSKQVAYKKFFRSAAYNSIKTYFEERKSPTKIKGIELGEIESWYKLENEMYNSMYELVKEQKADVKTKNEVIKPIGNELNKFVRSIERVNSKVKKNEDGCYELEVDDSKFEKLLHAFDKVSICADTFYESLDIGFKKELRSRINKESTGKNNRYGPGVQDAEWLVDLIEAEENRDDADAPRVNSWLNNPLVQGALVYQKIIDKIGDIESQDVIRNLVGLYVLNNFNNWIVDDIDCGLSDGRQLFSTDDGVTKCDKKLAFKTGIKLYNEKLRERQELETQVKSKETTKKDDSSNSDSDDESNNDNNNSSKYKEDGEYDADEKMASALMISTNGDPLKIPQSVQNLWLETEERTYKNIEKIGGFVPVPEEIIEVENYNCAFDDGLKVRDVKLSEVTSRLKSLQEKIKSESKMVLGLKSSEVDSTKENLLQFERLVNGYKVLASVYSWLQRNGYLKNNDTSRQEDTEYEILGNSRILCSNNTVSDVIKIILQRMFFTNEDLILNNENQYNYTLGEKYKNKKNLSEQDIDYHYDYPIGYSSVRLTELDQLVINTLMPLVFCLNNGSLNFRDLWYACGYEEDSLTIIKLGIRAVQLLNSELTNKIFTSAEQTGSVNKVFENIANLQKKPDYGAIAIIRNGYEIGNSIAMEDIPVADTDSPLIKIVAHKNDNKQNEKAILVYFPRKVKKY